MEGLIIIGIIVGIVIFRHLKVKGKLGEEIDTGLNHRIRLNEIKAEMTQQTGGVDDKRIQELMDENNNLYTEGWDTLNLMKSILTDLGCQPKKENEKELQVAYQGENFIINIGGPYAQIWDPAWANISVKDPNFENMKTAANISNFDFGPSIVWTTPNEDGMVTLHSKRDILLSPQLKDNRDYVRSVLDSFFEKKKRMRGQFHALINQQQEVPKPHRPVGFATTADEH